MILTDPETGEEMTVRRITVELDKPTRDGEKEVHLLSNVPEEDGIIADVEGVNGTDACRNYTWNAGYWRPHSRL